MSETNLNEINIDSLIKNCKTGDLLLYKGSYWYSKFIEFITGSNYSHVAMILRDPVYINPKLTGLYIIESAKENIPDSNTNKYNWGVQIIPLQYVIDDYKDNSNGEIYYRSLDCDRTKEFYSSLSETINFVEGDSYDLNLLDLIKIPYQIMLGNVHKDHTFVCSALITYLYIHLGLLDKDIPWTIISPRHFSYYENKGFTYRNCVLYPEKLIKLN